MSYRYSTAMVSFPAARISVRVPVARTDAQRAHGLRGRAIIDPLAGDGMLFELSSAEWAAPLFTMEGMSAPLDFFFIGNDGRITHIERNVQPGVVRVAGPPSVLVLEMGAGFGKRWRVRKGDVVRVA